LRRLVMVTASVGLVGAVALFVIWARSDVRVPQPGYPCLVVSYRGQSFKVARFERSRRSRRVKLTMPTPQPSRSPAVTTTFPRPPATPSPSIDGFDPSRYFESDDPGPSSGSARNPRIIEIRGYDLVADSETCW
jgi:hypothetical protein